MESYIGKVYVTNSATKCTYYYVFQESDKSVGVLEVTEREVKMRTYKKAAINTLFFVPSSIHNMNAECGDIIKNFLTILKHLSGN